VPTVARQLRNSASADPICGGRLWMRRFPAVVLNNRSHLRSTLFFSAPKIQSVIGYQVFSPTAEKKPCGPQGLLKLANQRSGAFEKLLSAIFLHLLGSFKEGCEMRLKSVLLDRKVCWIVLASYFFIALIPSTGEASLIGSRLSTGEQMPERAGQIQSIKKALEHKIVAQKLADYGLSPEEIMARMDTLDDKQLHQLASLSDEIGGGSAIGAIIGILVIVLLVVIILKLYDKTIVIK
jgi:hypothetical protein